MKAVELSLPCRLTCTKAQYSQENNLIIYQAFLRKYIHKQLHKTISFRTQFNNKIKGESKIILPWINLVVISGYLT